MLQFSKGPLLNCSRVKVARLQQSPYKHNLNTLYRHNRYETTPRCPSDPFKVGKTKRWRHIPLNSPLNPYTTQERERGGTHEPLQNQRAGEASGHVVKVVGRWARSRSHVQLDVCRPLLPRSPGTRPAQRLIITQICGLSQNESNNENYYG